MLEKRKKEMENTTAERQYVRLQVAALLSACLSLEKKKGGGKNMRIYCAKWIKSLIHLAEQPVEQHSPSVCLHQHCYRLNQWNSGSKGQ